jgi:hypothetical protein
MMFQFQCVLDKGKTFDVTTKTYWKCLPYWVVGDAIFVFDFLVKSKVFWFVFGVRACVCVCVCVCCVFFCFCFSNKIEIVGS